MQDETPEVSAAPPRWSVQGSGDLRADRRYDFGREALAAGDAAAAADLARQALELAPCWPPAWMLLGEAERATGRRAAAADAFGEVLRRDPADRLGAGLHLAALGQGDPATAMSPGYVAALFDDYAPRFERHLTETLGYRGPEQIVSLLRRLGLGPGLADEPLGTVLDVGCGTGLVGAVLDGWATRIEGCDLAPAMADRARRRGPYAAVAVADAVSFLRDRPEGSADLVTAADVLGYVGDPRPLFAAAAWALRSGGHFAFTLLTGPAEGLMLGEDLAFRHAPGLVADIGQSVGLPVVAQEAVAVRRARGVPLPGLVVACRRSPA